MAKNNLPNGPSNFNQPKFDSIHPELNSNPAQFHVIEPRSLLRGSITQN